ncbi:zinc-ribbon-domain-containing protein [Halteromyces radiatus]|uniref:zinc-ribbon-domain-containing protein n=1 Tax=Halteromyces radiatus TaxID=101107 RepID=UPI00221E50A2|nr:zinc-ribbon-domain-containing protein [Halteromyces radiatus]KAI8085159.1 zinc-ribbon-domain-containing protein [Halteromyces radiatus]
MSQSIPTSSDHTIIMKDNERSYYNKEKNILGCIHYQRNIKIQANCCQKIFPCRLCHDANSDHFIIRSETKKMLCMECFTLQPVGQWCTSCGTKAARYYCNKCQFWDDSDKSIYHCDDCGMCRQGKGLGIDFHHCKTCNVCMEIAIKDTHKCIEHNLECDCPICGEYMFTSTIPVIVMACGHGIHKPCYKKHIQSSYQCPICLKSLGDMSLYFQQLEKELDCQPMPEAYRYHSSLIFCNDCENKSNTPYHFFHHRCQICFSFNTTVLKTIILDKTCST